MSKTITLDKHEIVVDREEYEMLKKLSTSKCQDNLVKACQDSLAFLSQEIEAVIDEDLRAEYQRIIDLLQESLSNANA